MSELSKAIPRQRLIEEIVKEQQEGICFAVCGSSGVGKTSTINVLFNVEMKTEVAVPGTTDIYEVPLVVTNVRRSEIELMDIPLTVYDLPGLGDGHQKNSDTYFDWYQKIFPQMDVILWVIRADQRAYEFDINKISTLVGLFPDIKSRIIIGLNIIDKVEPNDWNRKINQPSSEQEKHYRIIHEAVTRLVHDQCGLTSNIISFYSAKKAYGLENLFTHLIEACPEGKKWVFADLKQDYRDAFLTRVPKKYREFVVQMYSQA